MIIATFNSSTGWAGRRIAYADGRFTFEGAGTVKRWELVKYDRLGQIDWARDGLREWAMARETAMSRQLAADGRLQRPLEGPFCNLVILERIAEGAGHCSWYLVHEPSQWEQVARQLHGGSYVSLYFDSAMKVARDGQVARREIETARRKQAEFVLGTTAVPPQAYWMNPFEIDVWLVDPSEALAEFIGEVAPAETLVWGEWPDPVDDGERGITLKLVDDDGVLRRHAY